ncbi:MAG: Vpu [Kiritimatiellales bacterium]
MGILKILIIVNCVILITGLVLGSLALRDWKKLKRANKELLERIERHAERNGAESD